MEMKRHLDSVNDAKIKTVLQLKNDYNAGKISLTDAKRILKEKVGSLKPYEIALAEQELKEFDENECQKEDIQKMLELFEDIMDTNVIKAVTTDDKEEIADLFNKYDLLSLPVVDHENRLVGIVTIDDAVDVMEEEATEDFEKMAAMLPSEKPYLKTSVLELAKNRITWLLVLMISSMLTGGILTRYEDAFKVMPLLVSFVPMLTDTGGNAGSQSSTMIIRGMTIGEVASSDIFKVIWKEARVSVVVGLILGLVNFIRLVIQYPGQPLVALTVVLALFATVFLAKVIGGILPILAKRLKLDPAIMAAPLITTIVDAVSLVIYFQIAVELLHIK